MPKLTPYARYNLSRRYIAYTPYQKYITAARLGKRMWDAGIPQAAAAKAKQWASNRKNFGEK